MGQSRKEMDRNFPESLQCGDGVKGLSGFGRGRSLPWQWEGRSEGALRGGKEVKWGGRGCSLTLRVNGPLGEA